MTISVTTVKEESVGPGTAAPFSPLIEGWAASEFVVYERTDATGVSVLLTDGVEYTSAMASPLPARITITPAASRAGTVTWVVYRVTPATQALDYVAQGTFPAESHEQGLDRAAARSQEHDFYRDRSMRLDEKDNDRDMVLPLEAARATFYAAYDANGQPTAIDPSTLTPTPVSLGAPAQTLLPYATEALWRTFLDLIEDKGDLEVVQAGTEAARAAIGAAAFGKGVWVTTDTHQLWYCDGVTWQQLVIEQLARSAIATSIAGRIILDTDRLELVYDNGVTTPPIRTLPPNHLDGLSMSWVDATNFQLESGSCRSNADVGQGSLGASMSKLRNTAGVWTAGAAGNMLDITAGATLGTDTWYWVFALLKPDGTLDWGIDDSATAANLLAGGSGATVAGFTTYRRVGMVKTNATGLGEFDQWNQVGDQFTWQTPLVYDTGASVSWAVGSNIDLTTIAPPSMLCDLGCHGGITSGLGIFAETVTIAAPSKTVVPGYNVEPGAEIARLLLRTNVSNQIRYRHSDATVQRPYVHCYGWFDPRGKDA